MAHQDVLSNKMTKNFVIVMFYALSQEKQKLSTLNKNQCFGVRALLIKVWKCWSIIDGEINKERSKMSTKVLGAIENLYDDVNEKLKKKDVKKSNIKKSKDGSESDIDDSIIVNESDNESDNDNNNNESDNDNNESDNESESEKKYLENKNESDNEESDNEESNNEESDKEDSEDSEKDNKIKINEKVKITKKKNGVNHSKIKK